MRIRQRTPPELCERERERCETTVDSAQMMLGKSELGDVCAFVSGLHYAASFEKKGTLILEIKIHNQLLLIVLSRTCLGSGRTQTRLIY